MAPAQRRLWFLDQLVPGHAFYTISAAVWLDSALEPALLQRAVDRLVERHESLRTTFAEVEGGPVQRVQTRMRVPVADDDLRALPADAREPTALARAADDLAAPFDLARGPLLRVRLLTLTGTRQLLAVTIHHIVSDAWSMGVLFRDLAALLEAEATHRPPVLPELTLQFADVAVWQAGRTARLSDHQLGYWRNHLRGAPALELATDRPRPAASSFSGATVRFRVEAPVTAAVVELARSGGATAFIALLAAWYAVLGRHADQDDVVVGVPVSGRDRSELEPLIGFFVNMLPVRCRLDRDQSFRELLGTVRELVVEALAHQDVPFDRVVEELHPDRDLSRHPLFQTAFQLHQRGPAGAGPMATVPEVTRASSNFDLNLELWHEGDGMAGRLTYATDLFDHPTAQLLVDHYRHLLAEVVAHPEAPLGHLELADDDERRRISRWECGVGDYRRDATVTSLFAEAAARDPAAPAVVDGRSELSYGQLDLSSDRLAEALLAGGLRRGEAVGVLAERSPQLVVTLLAVLKAGGAYVGLDPDDPPARRAWLQRAARCRFVLDPGAPGGTGGPGGPQGSGRDRPPVVPDQPAYLCFTSGSTGRPKGVRIRHRGVVRLVTGTSFHRFDDRQTYLMHSPLAFDASTLEIWGALCNGARLVVGPQAAPSLAELAATIEEHEVSTLWLTAGLFDQLVDEEPARLARVRSVLTGGDVVSPEHVRRLLALPGSRRVVNGYGPTENTTFTCCQVMSRPEEVRDPVPIGRPVTGTTVRIADAGGRAVAVGVPGDLWTGGAGLAMGYVDDPEATAAGFGTLDIEGAGPRPAYRTGDRARWLPDGTVEFLGRGDRQLKVRGFRVEPGEVEAALVGWPEVAQAVATATGGRGEARRLVGFVVPRGDRIDLDALADHLTGSLAPHLRPDHLRSLSRMPLTPNGKVDHAALARLAADGSGTRGERVPPRTEVEALLARIWAEVLATPEVGVTDDFFRDLAGHSLLGTRLVARIRRALGVDLPLRALFDAPTVAGMAEAVERLLIAELTSEGADR
jgi:amino acid adenylation domain-containing protein